MIVQLFYAVIGFYSKAEVTDVQYEPHSYAVR